MTDFYVERPEQEALLAAVRQVQEDRRTRTVLLQGPGGVGKTRLVRTMAERGLDDVVWLAPIDLDDPANRQLDRLSQEIARGLILHRDLHSARAEPAAGPFWRTRAQTAAAYGQFIEVLGLSAVVTLDTVEAAPGRAFAAALTQFMKELPATLFVLSGRPGHPFSGDHEITLGGFTPGDVERFLDAGPLRHALSPAERDKLVELTGGNPLWLSLTEEFLVEHDPPPELESSRPVDEEVRNSFCRRLITPYRAADFWSAATRRLAVVRHGVNREAWQHLMADLKPDTGSWEELQTRPWIRLRANGDRVALHDALAEVLVRHLIPLDDRDETWRGSMWHRAAAAFHEVGERAAELYYRALADADAGVAMFLAWHREATARSDLMFAELICHEIESALPGRLPVEVLVRVADTLLQTEQPQVALDLLDQLPDVADTELRRRIEILRGNACMRVPVRISDALGHFHRAQQLTEAPGLADVPRLRAEAYKELGYLYRNLGRWIDADLAYESARDALLSELGPGSSSEVREEMASIATNWAYLKALTGRYDEARNLVESGAATRRRLGDPLRTAISLSVSGEVYRYERRFLSAWEDYGRAEEIFQELDSLSWLGVLGQQQAICAFQAFEDGVQVALDPVALARSRIGWALEICREHNVRAYPSALNRAGRIYGAEDVDEGLDRLDQAIVAARQVADGWMLSASLIEYMELCRTAWLRTGDHRYQDLVGRRTPDLEAAIQHYGFPDVKARWQLLRGHLIARDSLVRGNGDLDEAVRHFAAGFLQLVGTRTGSHGASAVGREFARFSEVYELLPAEHQRRWYEHVRQVWTDDYRETTSLLARLEQLY